jgi:hypothetical protein
MCVQAAFLFSKKLVDDREKGLKRFNEPLGGANIKKWGHLNGIIKVPSSCFTGGSN